MTTVKKTHWFRNTLIVLIICGLVGTALAAVMFLGESNQTYATAAIQFSFDGAAEGKAPNTVRMTFAVTNSVFKYAMKLAC